MKKPATHAKATRVPYPKKPESARAWMRAHGISLVHLARANQIDRCTLSDLLRGRQKGLRGNAHLGAIVLGLKPEPTA